MGLVMYAVILILTCCFYLGCSGIPSSTKSPGLMCAHKASSEGGESETGQSSGPVRTSGIVQADNKSVSCPSHDHTCFTLWTEKTNEVFMQGCWKSSQKADDCNNDCSSSRPSYSPPNTNGSSNHIFFCCCRSNYCNNNYNVNYTALRIINSQTSKPLLDQNPDQGVITHPGYDVNLPAYILVPIVVVAVFLVISYFLYRRHLPPDPFTEVNEALDLAEGQCITDFGLDDLKISNVLDRGRYGEVWKGSLNDREVAVKKFGQHNFESFSNERDIYMLPLVEHASILKYFGSDERIEENGSSSFLMALEYCPNGALMAFLKNNSLDWATMCKMCQSIASGVGHLHNELTKGDKVKPAIAHRDINTRNILVKADLSCAICDFGFAMKIQGSRFYPTGSDENDTPSLEDVGTLRYMAPEVLEGAVNLRDCEASLKQIDVYSLGLVIWEVASRTTDLYQGLPMPEYQLPYQAEVGLNPTFDEMQLKVSLEKRRPAFPRMWTDNNQAVRALKETIEDCWDQDAEARLTSLCVEERVLEIMQLWEARQKGVTPTIYSGTTSFGDGSMMQRNPTSPEVGSTDTNGNPPDTTGDHTIGGLIVRHCRPQSVSESTIETYLTSPSEDPNVDPPPPPAPLKATNENFAKQNMVLQPHQGRNPVAARNTMQRSEEEVVIGNELQNKGHTFPISPGLDVFTDGGLENSLVQNDVLSHTSHRPHNSNPIDYVQNSTVVNPPATVRPKQHNVPGNGHSNIYGPNLMSSYDMGNTNPKTRLQKMKKALEKPKLNIFNRNPISKSQHNVVQHPSESEPLDPSGSNEASGYTRGKSNLDPRPLPTEVNIYNGVTLVRQDLEASGATSAPSRYNTDRVDNTRSYLSRGPYNGSLNGAAQYNGSNGSLNGATPLNGARNEASGSTNARLGMAEVGIAKLEPRINGASPLLMSRTKSQSSGDMSPSCSSLSSLSSDDSPRRPSSLRLKGHNYRMDKKKRREERQARELRDATNNNPSASETSLQQTTTIATTTSNKHAENNNPSSPRSLEELSSDTSISSTERIQKRIKTPFNLKTTRFSLYDDRMMSTETGSHGDSSTANKGSTGDRMSQSTISLQQFSGSGDVDVEALRQADFVC
ncbi:unnamed protein product [Owenia fusiformis]|uniref:receptor protein serine/threonine kinase n=1 Tax=Owenia fusiformis TaxID=6347 RepID=A0A8S4N0F6_OWEFU|nr:unnamed protein product [Owenia fusiformis]